MDRNGVQKTLKEIANLDNPLDYNGILTTCPKHERVVTKVIDSELLIGFVIHNNNDSVYKNCLELVKIINPKALNISF